MGYYVEGIQECLWIDIYIDKMRRDCIRSLKKFKTNYSYVTCDWCGLRAVCPYVYDTYNTDGDCLWEK